MIEKRTVFGICGLALAITACSSSGKVVAGDLDLGTTGGDSSDSDSGSGSPRISPACWQTLPDLPRGTGPSGRLEACSMVGTWKYEVGFNGGRRSGGLDQAPMVWSFDDDGRAIGGPQGTNLCGGFVWSANYSLGRGDGADASDGAVMLSVSNIRGDGAPTCGWGGRTTLNIEFSDDCRSVVLPATQKDACTGGGLFYIGKLTRID